MVGKRAKASDPDAGKETVLTAAGSFTGLWALTWLGAAAAGASVAVQGGFAVGGVMAASGLTVMWWKTRAIKQLTEDPEDGADELPETQQTRAT